jgi:threonine dehydratase
MNDLLAGLPAAIAAAARRIEPHILTTPTTASLWRDDFELLLKCEHLQYTGSFKLRGALNRLLSLTDSERDSGIIAASTGNHGQGIARAAQVAGVAAAVYVPATASPVKLAAMRAMGVAVETVDGDGLVAELTARAAAQAEGRVFVSPYNDAQVIAGQGTVGLELLAQTPSLDAVFVSAGGGGLISGVAAILKAHNPAIEVYGCWPENAPTLARCLEAGAIRAIEETPTISDGTAGGLEDGAITFELCQQLIDHQVLVSEADIGQAMRLLAENERWIVEGAAGVALAGALQRAPELAGKTAAVILCGRNIDFERFCEATGRS